MESISKQSGGRSSVPDSPARVHNSLELLSATDEAGKFAAGLGKQSAQELGEPRKYNGEAPEPSFLQRRPGVSCRPGGLRDDSTKPSGSDTSFDGWRGIVDLI